MNARAKPQSRPMNEPTALDAFGELIEPATLKIQRLLPGPIERIWAYLTDSELRRKWLAAGQMEMNVGAPFEFVWRNDELNDPPSKRPAGFPEEQRMQSRITELDPPRKLSIAWNSTGDVTFELEPKGKGVLLTIIHRRFPDRTTLLKIGDLTMNVLTRDVRRGEVSIHLALREFSLLEYMMRAPGQVHSRTSLCEHVWEYHFDTGTNVVDVYIKRLREKIDNDFEVKLLHTLRGVGYMIREPL